MAVMERVAGSRRGWREAIRRAWHADGSTSGVTLAHCLEEECQEEYERGRRPERSRAAARRFRRLCCICHGPTTCTWVCDACVEHHAETRHGRRSTTAMRIQRVARRYVAARCIQRASAAGCIQRVVRQRVEARLSQHRQAALHIQCVVRRRLVSRGEQRLAAVCIQRLARRRASARRYASQQETSAPSSFPIAAALNEWLAGVEFEFGECARSSSPANLPCEIGPADSACASSPSRRSSWSSSDHYRFQTSGLNPRARDFVPQSASVAHIASAVVVHVTAAVRAEMGMWMGTLAHRLLVSRRSGGRQRRAERVRRRGVRQLGCVHSAFVGEENGQRQFRSAAAAHGISIEGDDLSEDGYYSAEELDSGDVLA